MRVILLILIGLSSFSFAEFSKQNGVVTDSRTKLEWQDDYSDNGGEIKNAMWEDAIDYCEALSLDGGGWRLPNIKELISIVDDGKSFPAINNTFELIDSTVYWSSTSYSHASNYMAWYVNFKRGSVNYATKNSNPPISKPPVRCVRGGV